MSDDKKVISIGDWRKTRSDPQTIPPEKAFAMHNVRWHDDMVGFLDDDILIFPDANETIGYRMTSYDAMCLAHGILASVLCMGEDPEEG